MTLEPKKQKIALDPQGLVLHNKRYKTCYSVSYQVDPEIALHPPNTG